MAIVELELTEDNEARLSMVARDERNEVINRALKQYWRKKAKRKRVRERKKAQESINSVIEEK